MEQFTKKLSATLKSITVSKGTETKIEIKKGFVIMLVVVFLIIIASAVLFMVLSETGEPEYYTREELMSIIYMTDGMEWKCDKSGRTSVSSLFGIPSSGYMTTRMNTYDSMSVEFDDFRAFRAVIGDGCFMIETEGRDIPLYYSESGVFIIRYEDILIEWTRA